ncbi:MAG: hypothetical protein D6704_09900, partial [Nitrospirae bacterium]
MQPVRHIMTWVGVGTLILLASTGCGMRKHAAVLSGETTPSQVAKKQEVLPSPQSKQAKSPKEHIQEESLVGKQKPPARVEVPPLEPAEPTIRLPQPEKRAKAEPETPPREQPKKPAPFTPPPFGSLPPAPEQKPAGLVPEPPAEPHLGEGLAFAPITPAPEGQPEHAPPFEEGRGPVTPLKPSELVPESPAEPHLGEGLAFAPIAPAPQG